MPPREMLSPEPTLSWKLLTLPLMLTQLPESARAKEPLKLQALLVAESARLTE
jgi:hypothetical protein